MNNIAMVLRYRGTNYHGFQRQPNACTIQGEIEKALTTIVKSPVNISGCGRTDAGVHARAYVANFISECTVPPERLHLALNAILPEDICVYTAFYVPMDFDSRFSCIKKEYTYEIYNSQIKNPFLHDRTYLYKAFLDDKIMHKAAQDFVGKQDFAAVKSEGTPVSSTVRTVHYCNVTRCDDIISIKVCADGFLYNMVRAIAGTLLYTGCGKLCGNGVKLALESKKREKAGPTLPPNGLFMSKLWYEDFYIDESLQVKEQLNAKS